MDRATFDALAALVAHGDGRAYAQLLRLAAQYIRNYVGLRVTGKDRAAIEDIVQDTLLALHTRYQSYDPSMPFLPWLKTIAHHKLVDHWRRQNIAFLVSIDDTGDDLEDSAVAENRSDATLSLERMFDALTDKQRRVIQLAKLDGKSMAEIAAELKITVSDAKVTLHRALQKLSTFAQTNKNGEGHAHG
ncbi:MAG: sigma-70 family RNA polymerase sigma factor [Alphaproteobacteria bacterium]|nr:sigma-70 family RNA polymerase sigma factor [Alphaproteobacteria bacterium]